jgi:hypothetical protein
MLTQDREMKRSDKIRLTFELPGEMREFKEGEGMKPMSLSREFGFSMGKKSHLRPIVEGMIAAALRDEEAYAFDIEKLLGEPCLLSVSDTEKDGNIYANIASVSQLMRGMSAPEAFNKTSIIDVNTATLAEIDALPEFIRNKMRASEEYKARFADGSDIQMEPKDAVQDGDSPF